LLLFLAHARLVYRNVVIAQDAIMAIAIMDACVHTTLVLGFFSQFSFLGGFRSDFFYVSGMSGVAVLEHSDEMDVDQVYESQMGTILTRIGITSLPETERYYNYYLRSPSASNQPPSQSSQKTTTTTSSQKSVLSVSKLFRTRLPHQPQFER
jgi:hypothetical protein